MCRHTQFEIGAHHEAGHAAWEILHQRTVMHISVDEDGCGVTGTEQIDLVAGSRNGSIVLQDVPRQVEDQVQNLLAGLVAECIYLQVDNEENWKQLTKLPLGLRPACEGHDLPDAAWLLHKLRGHPSLSHDCQDCRAEVCTRMEQVAVVLRRHRERISALAKALIAAEGHRLDTDHILAAWCG